MKKIGIVSGFGAAAGAKFYARLVELCQRNGAVKDSDFPEVFLHNVSSNGMDETGVKDKEIVIKDLAESIRCLTLVGCSEIVIACNSLHVYFGELQKMTSVPIRNMVKTACDSLHELKTVGVMGSRMTRDTGLYRHHLESIGVEVMEPSESEQQEIDALIDRTIAGKITNSDRKIMTGLAFGLRIRGAEKIILGCTELPVICVPPECIDAGEKTIERMLEK